MAKSKLMNDDQLAQLSLIKNHLKPILEFDEIPNDATYYLKEDHEECHWIYRKLKLIGIQNGTIFFKDTEGITHPMNHCLNQIFIFNHK